MLFFFGINNLVRLQKFPKKKIPPPPPPWYAHELMLVYLRFGKPSVLPEKTDENLREFPRF